MAVQQLQLPGNYGAGPNNLVDQSQWSQLANLGNVYQKGQEQARQQTALASLGQDPAANAKALIGSGVPSLVELGMNAQNQQQAQAIRQAQEKRAQQTFEEDSPTGRIAKLKDAGINPADPAYRPYIVTGQNLPTGAADFTVEKVTNTDGTTSLVRVKKSGPEGPIDVGGAGAKPAIDPNITGDDYLAQLDPARANTIKAIAEGRQAPPTGYALRSPQVQSLLRDVAQYEPGFDLTLWKSLQQYADECHLGQGRAEHCFVQYRDRALGCTRQVDRRTGKHQLSENQCSRQRCTRAIRPRVCRPAKTISGRQNCRGRRIDARVPRHWWQRS